MNKTQKFLKGYGFAIMITAIIYFGIFSGQAERYPLIYIGAVVFFYIAFFVAAKIKNKVKNEEK